MIPIHQIPLPIPFPVGPINSYLILEPEPTLIDTGMNSDESWKTLETGMAAHGLKISDLTKVIITHPHVDHMGMARRIVEHSGAMVYGSEVARDWIVNTREMWRLRADYYEQHFLPYTALPNEIFEGMMGGMRQSAKTADFVPANRFTSFPDEGAIEIGSHTWDVLYMPGHTDYQVCFYQPQTKQFISADMLLLKAPTPIVERPLAPNTPRTPGLPKLLESFDIVDQLDIETVYPGHGPVFGDHRAVIEKQLRRIEMRKNECAQLIQDGCRTVNDILGQMYREVPPRYRFPALGMVVGYLDLLKAEDRVDEAVVDDIWHYSLKGD
ncbi:MAG: MBL fold metallo-hydrolase [Chloroflexota bacterium]